MEKERKEEEEEERMCVLKRMREVEGVLKERKEEKSPVLTQN